MTSDKRIAVVLFLSSALLFGCGGRPGLTPDSARQDEAPEPGEEASMHFFERTLNPSDFDEEVYAVRTFTDDTVSSGSLVIPSDSVTMVEGVGQGFRIQVFASAKIDEANAARRLVAERFPADSIYMVYDPPVYKIRVGNYRTRLEASRRLPAIVEQGYPDAWIVADRIVQRTAVESRDQERSRRYDR